MLSAIVFALGGSAKHSGRGASNKELIRNGASSAVVEVLLWNGDDTGRGDPYKPEAYGRMIAIERTVMANASAGSGYKLKNGETGRNVMDRGRVKEELDRMLQAFDISVQNPLVILNQDEAKTFLFKSTPESLYEFFMRATRLEDCQVRYNEAIEHFESAKTILKEKEEEYPRLRKAADKARKQLELACNVGNNQLLQRRKDKYAEFLWAVVKEKRDVSMLFCKFNFGRW